MYVCNANAKLCTFPDAFRIHFALCGASPLVLISSNVNNESHLFAIEIRDGDG